MTDERDNEPGSPPTSGDGPDPKVVPTERAPGEPDPATLPVTIFTVGYGNRSLDDLLALLDARSIEVALKSQGGPVSTETAHQVEDAILARARQLRIQDRNL